MLDIVSWTNRTILFLMAKNSIYSFSWFMLDSCLQNYINMQIQLKEIKYNNFVNTTQNQVGNSCTLCKNQFNGLTPTHFHCSLDLCVECVDEKMIKKPNTTQWIIKALDITCSLVTKDKGQSVLKQCKYAKRLLICNVLMLLLIFIVFYQIKRHQISVLKQNINTTTSQLQELKLQNTFLMEIFNLNHTSTLDFSYKVLSYEEVNRLNRMELPQLKTLILDGSESQDLKIFDNVHFLSLINTTGADQIISTIKNTSISQLDIGNNHLTLTSLEIINQMPNLQQISLANCNISQYKSIKLNSSKWVRLNLRDNILDSRWFMNNLIQLPSLQELSIRSNKLDDEFIRSISNFTNLVNIDASYNKLGKLDGIQNLKNIHSLNLNTNNLNNEGLMNLLYNLNYKYLELSNNNLTSVQAFQNKVFQSLQYLGLQNNQINDVQILKLGMFPNLQLLNLRHNNLTDKNKQYLVTEFGLDSLLI